MKPRSLLLPAVASLALVVSAAAQTTTGSPYTRPADGQDKDYAESAASRTSPDRSTTSSDRSTTTSAASRDRDTYATTSTPGAPDSPRRVTRDALDRQITAKDLIGETVYDRNGESIGSIADIGLGSAISGSMDTTTTRDQTTAGSSQSRIARSSPGTQPRPTSRGTSGTMDADAGQSRDYAANSPRDRSVHTRSMSGDLVAYISVGGVLGVGSELVRVPVSSLSYDETAERITADIRKGEIDSLLAAARTGDEGERMASVTAPGYVSPETGMVPAPGTTSPRRDAETIKSAIREDPTLESVAQRVTVTEGQNQVTVAGTVPSQAQKERLLDVADKHTTKQVSDQLRVTQP